METIIIAAAALRDINILSYHPAQQQQQQQQVTASSSSS